jgi:hypothetical protein
MCRSRIGVTPHRFRFRCGIGPAPHHRSSCSSWLFVARTETIRAAAGSTVVLGGRRVDAPSTATPQHAQSLGFGPTFHRTFCLLIFGRFDTNFHKLESDSNKNQESRIKNVFILLGDAPV